MYKGLFLVFFRALHNKMLVHNTFDPSEGSDERKKEPKSGTMVDAIIPEAAEQVNREHEGSAQMREYDDL